MMKIFFILTIFLALEAGSISAYAMGSPQSTNPNGPNYVPPSAPQGGQPAPKSPASPAANTCDNVKGCPPNTAAATKMTIPKMFYIPKVMNGLEIQKVPEDILDNSSLESWLYGMGAALIAFGFIYNMYMNLYRLSVGAEGKNKTHWQLFAQLIFAFVFLYVWSKGIFFTQYLTAVDGIQNYIWNSLTNSSGITGIETVVKHVIDTINGPGGSGFQWYNPFTWSKLQYYVSTVVLEFVFMIILFVVYLIYVVFYFLIYIFQLLIVGVLYALFPVALGLWVGEYSESIQPLRSWFKWFVEVSTWGVAIGLMDVIFNTVVENYLANAGLMTMASGVSLVVALGLVMAMVLLLLAGPFLIHKIFGMTGGGEHAHGAMGKAKNTKDAKDSKQNQEKIKEGLKALATGGASVPADMAKEGVKQGVNAAQDGIKEQGGNAGGGIAPGASTKLNEAK
ncbi:MAG: hypothetical protein M0Z57_07040 [Deltaproteobacteria bacterium]|jgi:hypothetical protein|nr:hypothetical protein [Deltaproteobacteria bacterium]